MGDDQNLDPATQVRYASVCKKYGVTSSTTWADIKHQVESTRNQNTRRSDIIALRSIIGNQGAMKIPDAIRKVYDLPSIDEIKDKAEGPYLPLIFAMAFAGLRAGEVCALLADDVKKVGDVCFIDVKQSRQNTGRYKQPKSGQGRVVIPEWLYDLLKDYNYPEILPNSLFKWMKRRGFAPHQLRHFYATYLVRTTKNPELARRQLRHSNLSTTLQIYVEIETQDELDLISQIPNPWEA